MISSKTIQKTAATSRPSRLFCSHRNTLQSSIQSHTLPFAARYSPVIARRPFVRAAASAPTQDAEQTFTYEAEVDRLMDMIVNSLYSNREVFLRELISNASDALDKVSCHSYLSLFGILNVWSLTFLFKARFISVTQPEVMKGREELEIRVSCDKEKKTITIEDSGIGMSREQLLSNLGTIARSGTRKFMEVRLISISA